MRELIECINQNTIDNADELKTCIGAMVCAKNDPVPLDEKNLLQALSIDGEFFVLKLHYNDFNTEIKYEKIKYKLSQALSVIISYEDDGKSYSDIEQFVKYINNISDDKQNSTFGVKNVNELSEYPITVLFSGILPINQLKMTVGSKIDQFIHSDDSYFKPRFAKHRNDISNEIGIPLLPVLPVLDTELSDFQVRLVDMHDERIISEFSIKESLNKDIIEVYLLKLFYIYKVLAQEKQYNSDLQ